MRKRNKIVNRVIEIIFWEADKTIDMYNVLTNEADKMVRHSKEWKEHLNIRLKLIDKVDVLQDLMKKIEKEFKE